MKSMSRTRTVNNSNFLHDLSKDSKSFMSSRIVEEIEDDNSSEDSKNIESESEEFDINNSFISSSQHSQEQSSQSGDHTQIKTNGKNKTSASSKTNKENKDKGLVDMFLNGPQHRNSDSSSNAKSRRNSVLSSAYSHTSKMTDLNLENIKTTPTEVKESKVSKKFSEQVSKRVVFLVMIVVMSK